MCVSLRGGTVILEVKRSVPPIVKDGVRELIVKSNVGAMCGCSIVAGDELREGRTLAAAQIFGELEV